MTVRPTVETHRSAPGGTFVLHALPLVILFAATSCTGTPLEEPGVGLSGCVTAADCDDGNACTIETCAAGSCSSANTLRTAAALLGAGPAGTDSATVAVARTEGSVIPRTTHIFCPDGPDPSRDPPRCVGQLDLPAVADASFTQIGTGGTLLATVPIRFPDLIVHVFQTAGSIGGGSVSVSGNRSCPGAAQTYANLPVEVRVTVDKDGVLATLAAVDEVALANATAECITGNVATQVQGLLMEAGRTLVRAHLQAALVDGIETQFCAGPPCAAGFAESGGLCRKGGLASGPCMARPPDPITLLLVPAACAP